jgi:hypothetical protein
MEDLPSVTPASPLAPPGSAHTFGDSLRQYAREIREREEKLAKNLREGNGLLDRVYILQAGRHGTGG